MYFVEIVGSKSKQQNNMNFNEIALIFRLPSKPSTGRKQTFSADGFDESGNIRAISLKLLLF